MSACAFTSNTNPSGLRSAQRLRLVVAGSPEQHVPGEAVVLAQPVEGDLSDGECCFARGSNSGGELLQHPANHSEGMLPSKWPARLHTAFRHRSLTREHRLRASVWEQQRTTANNNRCRSFAALPSASLRAGRTILLRRSVISVQDSSRRGRIRVKDGCPDAVHRHGGARGGLHTTE